MNASIELSSAPSEDLASLQSRSLFYLLRISRNSRSIQIIHSYACNHLSENYSRNISLCEIFRFLAWEFATTQKKCSPCALVSFWIQLLFNAGYNLWRWLHDVCLLLLCPLPNCKRNRCNNFTILKKRRTRKSTQNKMLKNMTRVLLGGLNASKV